MKIKEVVETELNNFRIEIVFTVKSDGTVTNNSIYSYDCPDCSGYGCMQNRKLCYGGTVSKKLDMADLIMPENVSSKIKDKLLELGNSIKS